MKKNDIFTFTAPNGVKVTAVVLSKVAHEVNYKWAVSRFLCYSQNRLFTYQVSECIWEHMQEEPKYEYGEVIADYAILPDYDSLLDNYKSKEI